MIGTNGSSVAFQKQEIATLDKFYLYHTPEIFEITRKFRKSNPKGREIVREK